jgi:hypothetical protein
MRQAQIHQPQRVVSVVDGSLKIAELQPANPPMVVLHELTIDLQALRFVELKSLAFSLHQVPQVFEVRRKSVGPRTIGPPLALHLQQPHVQAHLDDFATLSINDANTQSVGFIGPRLQDVVDVLAFTHPSRAAR